jgi:gas vesicle protein
MDEENKLSYFFLGLGLGVAAGLLFAPKSGTETRDYLKTKSGEGADFVKRRSSELRDSAGGLLDRGKQIINKQREQLNSAVDAGKQAYRDAVSGTTERNVSNEGF